MRNLTAFLILATALTGCSSDPVDRELVGTWQTAIASPTGAWQLRFTTLSNGQYRTDFFGPFPVPPETGYFAADDGEWRIEKITGSIEEGTYEFLSKDSVLFRAPAGAIVWNRVATGAELAAAGGLATPGAPGFTAPGLAPPGVGNAPSLAGPAGAFGLPPAPAAAAGAFGAPPAPAAPDASASVSGVTADLLTTGPFGSAPQAAANTAAIVSNAATSAPNAGAAFAPSTGTPFGAATTPAAFGAAATAGAAAAAFYPPGVPVPPAPLGVPKAVPSSVFAATPTVAAAAGLEPAPGLTMPTNIGAVGGSVEQLDSAVRGLTDLPRQTADDVASSAKQTAGQVVGEATAPVAEAADEATRKAGERLQTFGGNAASKVKNFFTGHNRKKNEAEPAPQEDR
jgi:hypothetical protein